MKIKQLSVFLENRPGHLSAPCACLADAGINILTLTLADTERFGILRLIVREWKRAKKLLDACGCVVKLTEVVAVEVEHCPGGLRKLLEAIEREPGVNIEYMYAYTDTACGKAVMIFRFDDLDAGIAALQKGGIAVLSGEEFYELNEIPF